MGAEELNVLADILKHTFIQRDDLYARQRTDGRYTCVREPLQSRHLIAHLQGKLTLGAYLLDRESRGRFFVLDGDDEQEWVQLSYIAQQLHRHNIATYLEQSRRGGHLWFFFDQPRSGLEIRTLGQGLMKLFGTTTLELYPKQPVLTGSVGSLIRLPFGIHRKSGQRYGFVDLGGRLLAPTIPAQLQQFAQPQPIPNRLFDAFVAHEQNPPMKPDFERSEHTSGTVSQRLKDAISVHDFVSRFVELSATGVGLCPFHDDQIASFSVNVEENYWHCFACETGGSIIDFWMQYRQCDFKQALRELARMLLK